MAQGQHYLFQYCQKLVILSKDRTAVLLARRKNEADYDGVYGFIGGKMEVTDESMIAAMAREKVEEIGENAIVRVLPSQSFNVLYRKKDGLSMILPHIAGLYISGKITLNKGEYDSFKWVLLKELAQFEPKIETVYPATIWARDFLSNKNTGDLMQL